MPMYMSTEKLGEIVVEGQNICQADCRKGVSMVVETIVYNSKHPSSKKFEFCVAGSKQ